MGDCSSEPTWELERCWNVPFQVVAPGIFDLDFRQEVLGCWIQTHVLGGSCDHVQPVVGGFDVDPLSGETSVTAA